MKIGVWGDSIVYGGGDETGLGWVGLLRNYYYEKDYTVYKQGVCGDTTKELLKRFETELHSSNPDIVVFAIGINDSEIFSKGGGSVTHEQDFKKNIQTLISIAQQKTEKIIVIGLTDVDFEVKEIAMWFSAENIRRYDSCLEEVAKEMHVTYITMRHALDVQADLVDGIHPNAEGYKKMFTTIFPAVESVVSN